MMYNPDVLFEPSKFIQTVTGNRISRTAELHEAHSLEIPHGKVVIKCGVILHCNLARIIVGKYTIICEDVVLRPPQLLSSSNPLEFIPITIGSHCYFGSRSVVEAAVIGTGCYIGDDCILSPRTVLKDYVYVSDGTVVPSDMVLPPFAIVSGNPARIVGDMPESTSTLAPRDAVLRYKAFKPASV